MIRLYLFILYVDILSILFNSMWIEVAVATTTAMVVG